MIRFGALGILLSLVFPGFGQGLAGKRNRMLGWLGVALVSMLLCTLTIWIVPLFVLVRIASAIDAYRCVTRADRDPRFGLAAIAFFAGALSVGAARLAVEGFKIPSSSMEPTLVIGDHIMVEKVSKHWHSPEPGEVVVFTQPCSRVTWVKRVIARGGDTVEVRCATLYVNGKALPSKLVSPHTTYQDRNDGTDTKGLWAPRQVSRYRETLGSRSYETFHDATRPALDEKHEPFTNHDFPSRDKPFPPSCAKSGMYYDDLTPTVAVPLGTLVETKPASEATACEAQLHYVVPKGTLFVMGDNRENANDSRYWGPINENAVIGRIVGIWMSDGPDGSWGRFGALE